MVADMHVDTLRWVVKGYDLTAHHRWRLPLSAFLGHVDLPRLRQGGVRIVFFYTVSLPLPGVDSMGAAQRSLAAAQAVAAGPDSGLVVMRTGADLEPALAGGRIAAVLGLEGAYAVGRSLGSVARLYERGLRCLGLVHVTPSHAGYPSYARALHRDGGLTPFGHALIEEAERLGILVDLAHANPRTFADAIQRSRRPVIVSHTGVAAISPSWRNLDDEQLRMVARTGGVVGIFFASAFLRRGRIRASVDDVARHVCHAVSVAGIDHVGIGSDFDGGIVPPEELPDCGAFPVLAAALVRAGLSDDGVARVMGGNVARLLRDALPVS